MTEQQNFLNEPDDGDDRVDNPNPETPIGAVIAARLSRRGFLAGASASTVVAVALPEASRAAQPFAEVPHGVDGTVHVAAGYHSSVIAAWGDPVDGDGMELSAPTGAAQLTAFGYNNDFLAFMPLPRGSATSDRGLLCVNHEYTNAELMFPGMTRKTRLNQVDDQQIAVEMAAHGHSVLEIKKTGGDWTVVPRSPYNRRITASETRMRISGPTAGHKRLKTSRDPTGTAVIGTLNNCAGGTTPWGTVLVAEENFNFYFGGELADHPEKAAFKRYGIKSKSRYGWSRVDPRFDIENEPNEPNRFGWIVEFDPYDPESVPVKRTALGRFKHEGATCAVNSDGRIVVYSGDDQRFDYVYKFVSRDSMVPNDPAANRDLLDHGTLYVARFEATGVVTWLPLIFGTGPLTADNGFHSQADVLIEARRAADLLEATPMDRPEDVEANPVTGRVYVILTNNSKRLPGNFDAANPRAPNKHGHIIEIIPPGGDSPDHAADTCQWTVFLMAGDPSKAADKARYHPDVSENGWLSVPDNCTFDRHGRLWIATDGAEKSASIADGVFVTDVEGSERALTRQFMRGPVGSEICGPAFTPDNTTLFLAIQHPGQGSTYDRPSTRWPDFKDNVPPRPGVIAIRRNDGGPIGD